MKTLTLVFLFRDNKILLARKKRSFGVGKWNGYGGKLEGDETSIQGVIRELEEESTLKLGEELFKEVGCIDFYFDDKKEWNQKVIIYRVDDFGGEPQETEEMIPKWFELDKIPYEEMWKGDDEWVSLIIEGKRVKGEIHFSKQGEELSSVQIESY